MPGFPDCHAGVFSGSVALSLQLPFIYTIFQEVNISICQTENSDIHRGEVNITVLGLSNPDVNQKNAPIVVLYDTVSLLRILKNLNLLKPDVPSALKKKTLFKQ